MRQKISTRTATAGLRFYIGDNPVRIWPSSRAINASFDPAPSDRRLAETRSGLLQVLNPDLNSRYEVQLHNYNLEIFRTSPYHDRAPSVTDFAEVATQLLRILTTPKITRDEDSTLIKAMIETDMPMFGKDRALMLELGILDGKSVVFINVVNRYTQSYDPVSKHDSTRLSATFNQVCGPRYQIITPSGYFAVITQDDLSEDSAINAGAFSQIVGNMYRILANMTSPVMGRELKVADLWVTIDFTEKGARDPRIDVIFSRNLDNERLYALAAHIREQLRAVDGQADRYIVTVKLGCLQIMSKEDLDPGGQNLLNDLDEIVTLVYAVLTPTVDDLSWGK